MRELARSAPLFFVIVVLAACGDETRIVDHPGVLEIGPTSISFGGVVVGDRAVQEVTVRAPNTPVFLAIESSGLSPSFTISPRVIELRAGTSGTVDVAFAPTSEGFFEGTIEFRSSNGLEGVVQFDGVGLAPSGDPLEVKGGLDFGDVLVGDAVTLPLVLQSRSLEAMAIEISGDVDSFRADVDRFELAPGERRILSVSFLPRVRGAQTSTFRIKGCGQCGDIEVVATGRGLATELRATPDRIEFETALLLQPEPRRRSVTLENVGDFEIEIGNVYAEGAGFDVWWADLPPSLGVGETAQIEAAFYPPFPGESEGSVYIEDKEGGALASIPLVGWAGGPSLRVRPTFVNFGYLPIGETSAPVKLVIENVGDPVPVNLVGMGIVGADTASFEVRRVGSGRIEPKTELEVKFTASRAGSHAAELRLQTDFEGQRELRVPLTGAGTHPIESSCNLHPIGHIQIDENGIPFRRDDEDRIIFQNVGRMPCVVWDFRLSNPLFRFVSAPQGVTTVIPGDWFDVVYGWDIPPRAYGTSTLGFETQYGPVELTVSGLGPR